MRKLGLKLWSTNGQYIPAARALFERGFYDYIELYAAPDSFDNCHALWAALGVPFIIHAPHFGAGVNLALREKEPSNLAMAAQAQKWADALKAQHIIFHPGIGGDIKETARQLNLINDPRALIENKPHNISLGPDYICNGATLQEIKYVLSSTKVGFCLDVGHAFCAANSLGKDKTAFLQEFLAFGPKIIHLSDGDKDSKLDSHLHLGQGSYDLKTILGLVPADIPLSIETQKNSPDNLYDFEADIHYLKNDLTGFNFSLAAPGDMDDVFRLVNESVIRENSLNSNPILLEDHQKWFPQKIKDKNSLFFIIRKEGVFAGYIRFELQDCSATVSVALTAALRGRGRGAQLLQYACAMAQSYFDAPIKALIKLGNQKSIAAFTKAGFISFGLVPCGDGQECVEMHLPPQLNPKEDRREISFLNILNAGPDLQNKVLEYRNNPEVNQYFFTQKITPQEHKKWLLGLKGDSSRKSIIFFADGEPAGIFNVGKIDCAQKTAEAGSYLFNLKKDSGGGVALAAVLFSLDALFSSWGIKTIFIQVLKNNPRALNFNKFLGYEVYAEQTIKGAPAYLLRLSKEKWLKNRYNVLSVLDNAFTLKGDFK